MRRYFRNVTKIPRAVFFALYWLTAQGFAEAKAEVHWFDQCAPAVSAPEPIEPPTPHQGNPDTVPVSPQEIAKWLVCVPGIDPDGPRAAQYVRAYNVVSKIQRAKLDGRFYALQPVTFIDVRGRWMSG